MTRLASRIGWSGFAAILATACVLAGAAFLGMALRSSALPVETPQQTTIGAETLPTVIGREHLGQHPGPRSAALRHLRIDRERGHWIVANAASDRRVFARTRSGRGFYLHRWPLQSGDRIVLPAASLEVTIDAQGLGLRDVDSGRRARFEGRLEVPGASLAAVCQSRTRRIASRARWLLRGLAGGDELRLFSIGGGVDCSNRFALAALEAESFRINWQEGRFQVAPGRSSDALFSRGDGPGLPFAARGVVVDGEDPITRLILGRTVYAVSSTRDELQLDPVANRDLWRDELPEGPLESAPWSGAGRGGLDWLRGQALLLAVGLGIAGLVGAAVGVLLARRRDAASLAPVATGLAFGVAAFGGWTALLTQRGEAADALLRYGLLLSALGAASVSLALRARLRGIGGLVWITALSLSLVGTLNLLLLGAGADSTQWMRFFDKHALILTLFGFTMTALGALPPGDLRRAWVQLFDSEWIVAGAGLLLVFGMGAQLGLGSEAGIGGLQPVELTKTVFVVLLGFAGMHLVEVRRRDTREYRRSPVTVLLPFLRIIGGFALIVMSVVVGVRDFSPGIILGLVTIFWLFQVGRPEQSRRSRDFSRWSLLRPAAVLLLAGVFAAATWARLNAEELPAGMPQRDRLLVWAQPELHPHSGSQVLAAMERVADGGWTGAREWFGPNEEVMQVPAVQDDFITAFFLNRFGGVAGLVLLSLQLAYLSLLFTLARRIERSTQASDFREQNAGRVLHFTLFGLAWMHTVHWGIAWGNTLGLLPVMGQPMTWMSAGNSHLTGFALLSLVIALGTSFLLLEIEREGA